MGAFHVPGAEPGRDEDLYEQLAKACQRPVPAGDRRIESVTFMHDRIEYTATVGEKPRGLKYRYTRSGRRDDSRPPDRVTHGNTVIAIFAGSPYLMWTELGRRPSYWVNPAMLGQPSSIQYFTTDGSTEA